MHFEAHFQKLPYSECYPSSLFFIFVPFAKYHVRKSVYRIIPIRVDQSINNIWKLFMGTSPFARSMCLYERKAIDVPGIKNIKNRGVRNRIISANLDDIFIRTKSTTAANNAKSMPDPIKARIPIVFFPQLIYLLYLYLLLIYKYAKAGTAAISRNRLINEDVKNPAASILVIWDSFIAVSSLFSKELSYGSS